MNFLKINRLILVSIALLLLILTASAIYFSPYYLDGNPPLVEIGGIESGAAYREIIEFAIDCRDLRIGIKAIKIFVDENNLEFEKKLDLRPNEHRETVKINSLDFTDGQHKLIIDVVDASWRRNHSKLELEITIDNTPPEIELILKHNIVKQGNTLMVLAKINEPVGNINADLFGKTAKFYENDGLYRSLVGVSVYQKTGRHVLDLTVEDEAGNRCKTQKIVQVIDGNFERGVVNLPKNKKRLLTDSNARKIDRTKRAKAYSHFEQKQLWRGKSINPTEGWISSTFGKQRVYNNGVRASTHLGLDIANVTGTPVKAANSGIVALATETPIHGKSVIVDHGQKVFSSYNHLSRLHVHVGEMVKKGQLIGEIGTTGQSTGAHLHWGFLVNGVSVNPLEWIERSFSHGKD